MTDHHPCRCDICYKARDAELARVREGMAEMIATEARTLPTGRDRMMLVVASHAIRRGRFLTEQEKLENLKAALAEENF